MGKISGGALEKFSNEPIAVRFGGVRRARAWPGRVLQSSALNRAKPYLAGDGDGTAAAPSGCCRKKASSLSFHADGHRM